MVPSKKYDLANEKSQAWAGSQEAPGWLQWLVQGLCWVGSSDSMALMDGSIDFAENSRKASTPDWTDRVRSGPLAWHSLIYQLLSGCTFDTNYANYLLAPVIFQHPFPLTAPWLPLHFILTPFGMDLTSTYCTNHAHHYFKLLAN